MIIFLRHGQTVFNIEHKYQGTSDSPLTEQGILQAMAMARLLTAYQPVHYYLSPAPRVWATFKYMKDTVPAPHTILRELCEICYGEWEGKTKMEAEKSPLWGQRENDRFHFVHPGSHNGKPGESYAQQYKRLIPLLERFITEGQKDNIFIIAHQGVLVCVKKYFAHLSDEEAGKVRVQNDTALVVEINGNEYRLVEKQL